MKGTKRKASAALPSSTLYPKKRTRLPKKRVSYAILPEIQRLADAGIQNSLNTLNLHFSTDRQSSTGNRSLRNNSVLCYEKQIRGKVAKQLLWISYLYYVTGIKWWCSLIGDYESLLILSENRVLPRTPSIRKESLEMFILFKTLKPGTLLKYNGRVVRDVLNKTVRCDGSWDKGKDAMNQFLSAMSALHNAKDNSGPYVDRCENCAELRLEERHRGCIAHPGNP